MSFDFRDLRTVKQLVDESRPTPESEPTLRAGTVRDWIFYSAEYDFDSCIVRVGRRIYVHLPSFNAWLERRLGKSA